MEADRSRPAGPGGARAPCCDGAPRDETPLGRGRRWSIRVLAVLALLAFNFMLVFVATDAVDPMGSVPELVAPGSVEARIGAEHPGEMVHLVGAVTALAFGVVGLAGLIVRPQRAGSATQVGVAAVAWLLVSVVVGDPDNQGGQAGFVDLAFIVLALPALVVSVLAAPWRAWGRGGPVRPRFLLLAGLGLPWAWYGFQQGLMQRDTWPPMADPHHQAHWFAMSLAALLVLLVGASGALPGTGWQLGTTLAGFAAVAVGTASLVATDAASALDAGWAIAAVLWGIAMLALTTVEGTSSRVSRMASDGTP